MLKSGSCTLSQAYVCLAFPFREKQTNISCWHCQGLDIDTAVQFNTEYTWVSAHSSWQVCLLTSSKNIGCKLWKNNTLFTSSIDHQVCVSVIGGHLENKQSLDSYILGKQYDIVKTWTVAFHVGKTHCSNKAVIGWLGFIQYERRVLHTVYMLTVGVGGKTTSFVWENNVALSYIVPIGDHLRFQVINDIVASHICS